MSVPESADDATTVAEVFAPSADWVWVRRFPDPDERDWWRQRCRSAVDASLWQEVLGQDWSRVQAWTAAGAPPIEAATWIALGFTASSTGTFLKAHITPQDAVRWRAAGLIATHAAGWVAARVTDPQEAARLSAQGISGLSAPHWVNSGFTFPEAVAWHDAGVPSAHETNSWIRHGFDSPQEAGSWRALKVPPKAATMFRRHGYSADYLSQWCTGLRVPASVFTVRVLQRLSGFYGLTPETGPGAAAKVGDGYELIRWSRLKVPVTDAETAGRRGVTAGVFAKFDQQHRRAVLDPRLVFNPPGEPPVYARLQLRHPLDREFVAAMYGPEWRTAKLLPPQRDRSPWTALTTGRPTATAVWNRVRAALRAASLPEERSLTSSLLSVPTDIAVAHGVAAIQVYYP